MTNLTPERITVLRCCCGLSPNLNVRQVCLRRGFDTGYTTQHCDGPGDECEGCPRRPVGEDA